MCVPAPLTAYRAIKKLEPGHTLRWRKGEIKIERYWQPDFSKKLKISEQEAGERAIEIIARRGEGAVDVGSPARSFSLRRHRLERGSGFDERRNQARR